MQALDIMIEDPRWSALDLPDLVLRVITRTLEHLHLDPEIAELSLLACDDGYITTLNAEFREKPQPTNVLSWPSEERAGVAPGDVPQAPVAGPDGLMALGDIAVSFDTCARESVAAHKDMADHVTHLIVHGTLHLLGYDHETEQDAALMEGLEVEILGKLGLRNPYIES